MTTVETAILTRSPPHPPKSPQTGGRWPRPRKPTAPRADGHERALRATRNPPSPHVEARKRFACLSTFNPLLTPFREMRIQCGILFRLSPHSATTLASPASVTSLAFATKNANALRAPSLCHLASDGRDKGLETQNLSPKPRTISTPSRDTIARGS